MGREEEILPLGCYYTGTYAHPPHKQIERQHALPRILVVEDDPTLATLAAEILPE